MYFMITKRFMAELTTITITYYKTRPADSALSFPYTALEKINLEHKLHSGGFQGNQLENKQGDYSLRLLQNTLNFMK